jgi:ubiquinone/menaquinone biosynthesis C-methylase UbiE
MAVLPHDGDQPSLPPAVVPADRYDEDYYLNMCAGCEAWTPSGGAEVADRYPGSLAKARLQPGEVVVDIGTGRGELLAVAINAFGAARAIGVEYAEAAITMANQTLELHGVADRAEAVLADARAMPIESDTADLVTMLDVVEHLAPEELRMSLAEALRILRPGGRLFIHTVPTRTIYNVTYRALRWSSPRRLGQWPANPRNDYELQMHCNEQTRSGLRRSLRAAGFRPIEVDLGKWIYTDFIPDERYKRVYHRLARHRLTAPLGVANLFATAWKQG